MEGMRGTTSITDRIMGIVTFKAPVYREVAEDPAATQQALIIVVATAILSGILSGVFTAATQGSNGSGTSSPIGSAIVSVVLTLLGWVIGAWVLAFVAKTFFNGRTDFQEMLRVTGYVAIFNVLQIIPILGALAAAILLLIGYIVGIREAAEITTAQAVGVGIITIVIYFVVFFVLTVCAGLIFVAGRLSTGG